jgi:LysM repeat protein
MWYFRVFIIFLVIFLAGCNLGAEPTVAPTPTLLALNCDQLVTTALQTADQVCANLGRNQACYGHRLVSAQLQPDANVTFNTTGDIADVFAIRSLSTAPLDEAEQVWGVAVLKVQANLPDTLPGQNVTLLLYGDAIVDNITPQMQAVALKTGVGSTTCASAPESAMLLQSPEGTQATLNINGASVTMGSTLYVKANAGQEMTIATIEGQAIVSAANTTRIAQAGAQVRLPLGGTDQLQVIGPPSDPEPFDVNVISQAPINLLERNVVVGPAIDPSSSPPATATVNIVAPTSSQPCAPRTDWAASYTVQRGDTLFSIAQRFNLTSAQLQQGNCIADPNRLQIGQVLRVPFTLPTSVPPTSAPVGTATPTNPNLRADSTFLQPGECTTIRWDVANISQVFFEGQPTVGSTQQVCPRTSTTYTLLVIHPDGKQVPYTLRIEVALPQEEETEEPPRSN